MALEHLPWDRLVDKREQSRQDQTELPMDRHRTVVVLAGLLVLQAKDRHHTDFAETKGRQKDSAETDQPHTDFVEQDQPHTNIVEQDRHHTDFVEQNFRHTDSVEKDHLRMGSEKDRHHKDSVEGEGERLVTASEELPLEELVELLEAALEVLPLVASEKRQMDCRHLATVACVHSGGELERQTDCLQAKEEQLPAQVLIPAFEMEGKLLELVQEAANILHTHHHQMDPRELLVEETKTKTSEEVPVLGFQNHHHSP